MKKSKSQERIGEVGYSKNGDSYKIIKYNKDDGVIIQFEDGATRKTTYKNIINRTVLHPNLYKKRVGEIKVNNQGLKMEIIAYHNCNSVDILFENGDIINRPYEQFRTNKLRSLIFPHVHGVGFLGYGKYVSTTNGKETLPYQKWSAMLDRCYGLRQQEKYKSYVGCSVCEEWHNYQNFAKWYEENIWNEEFTVLDKDILIKGNKVYSPDTCILVNTKINTLFINNKADRGDCPVGVCLKDKKYYEVGCSVEEDDGKRHVVYLGRYLDKDEAFMVYKTFKESYIKRVADKYKSKYSNFPIKLYDAMYEWKIEMTD